MRTLMTTTQQPTAAVSSSAGEPSELEKLFGPGLMTEKQFAEYTGLSPQLLAKMRKEGRGPRFVRLGMRRLGIRPADGDAWLRSRENMPAGA